MFIYMVAQTTDSAPSNNFLAREMQRMFFANENDPVFWNSQGNHVRCFCHKLALAVKHGLETIELKSGHVKPTTQPDVRMPIPIIRIVETNSEGLPNNDSNPVTSESEIEGDRHGLERVIVEDSEDDLPAEHIVSQPTWGLVTSGVKKVS